MARKQELSASLGLRKALRELRTTLEGPKPLADDRASAIYTAINVALAERGCVPDHVRPNLKQLQPVHFLRGRKEYYPERMEDTFAEIRVIETALKTAARKKANAESDREPGRRPLEEDAKKKVTVQVYWRIHALWVANGHRYAEIKKAIRADAPLRDQVEKELAKKINDSLVKAAVDWCNSPARQAPSRRK